VDSPSPINNIGIATNPIKEQINDIHDLLRVYKDILMWQPQSKTHHNIIFHFQGGSKLHVLLGNESLQSLKIESFVVEKSKSDFYSSLATRKIEGITRSISNLNQLHCNLKRISQHLCLVNRILAETRYLSHRYNLRTSNIRKVTSLVTNPHLEFEFSSLVNQSKFLILVELSEDYLYKASNIHINILFGIFSKQGIEEAISNCFPGYGLLTRICTQLMGYIKGG